MLDGTKLTAPRILVLMVVGGAILEGLGLYGTLVEIGHNGATIPLPGFGYALAHGAIEGAKKSFLGALMGGISSTAAGVTIAIVFGYFVALLSKPKTPK